MVFLTGLNILIKIFFLLLDPRVPLRSSGHGKRNKSQGLRKNKLKIAGLGRNEKVRPVEYNQTSVRLTGK